MTSREEFEVWMRDYAKIVVGSGDPYPAGLERDYWRVWQASRAALEFDLSDLSNCFSPDDCGDWAIWLSDVKTLLEAAGLRAKP